MNSDVQRRFGAAGQSSPSHDRDTLFFLESTVRLFLANRTPVWEQSRYRETLAKSTNRGMMTEYEGSVATGPFDEIELSLCLCIDAALCNTDQSFDFGTTDESYLLQNRLRVLGPVEQDPRLDELAMAAVRTKHRMHGVEFDENCNIDVLNDIECSVVTLALPLGIFFREKDVGCRVTEVFPNGNAAKSGFVEVGDHLAAINGASAIDLRVDELYSLISNAPDQNEVELIFLRYIGPLHPIPGDVPIQEVVFSTMIPGNDMKKSERKPFFRKEGTKGWTLKKAKAADVSKVVTLITTQDNIETIAGSVPSKTFNRYTWVWRRRKYQPY